MSDIILKAVTEFVMKHNPVNITELQIVIFDKTVFKSFKEQVSSTFTGNKPGFWTKLKGKLLL